MELEILGGPWDGEKVSLYGGLTYFSRAWQGVMLKHEMWRDPKTLKIYWKCLRFGDEQRRKASETRT